MNVLIWISVLILTVLSKRDSCLSIKNSTICAPYSGKDLYIDAKVLSRAYAVKTSKDQPFNVTVWERLVQSTTQGGKPQEKMWKKWAACDNYKGEQLQYFRSYVCMTDIFVYSKECNKKVKSMTPFCPEVCDNYGSAVTKMINDESICPTEFEDLDEDEVESIMKRRKKALKALKSCKKMLKLPFFNPKEQCVVGVKSDQDSCGMANICLIL